MSLVLRPGLRLPVGMGMHRPLPLRAPAHRRYATPSNPSNPWQFPQPPKPPSTQQPPPGSSLEGPGRPEEDPSARQRHREFYTRILPTWMPIVVIGTAVFLALQMTRAQLAQERYTKEIHASLSVLGEEYVDLQARRMLRTGMSNAAGPTQAGAGPAGQAGKKARLQPGHSEVLAATLPTLVTPTTPGDEAAESSPTQPTPGAEVPSKGKSWWSRLTGR